jgi:hypothetical protein
MSWFNNKKEGDNHFEKLPELPQLPELPEPTTLPSLKKDLPPPPIPGQNSQVQQMQQPPQLQGLDVQIQDLPDLPPPMTIQPKPLPQLPNLNSQPKTVSIPNKPITPMQKSNFSYENAVVDEIKERSLPQIDSSPRTVEIGYSKTQGYSAPATKKSEPIFIRLDKFESTVENFEEIKEKINEIEEVLQKTREIKAKEEEELSEWEKEIQIIKARLDSIDRNLLNKLD